MKKNSASLKNNQISFNSEEEKLLKKYLDEYNDLYQKILIYTPNDFIQILKKMLLISLKDKINGFSKEIKYKIEDFIIEKIYCHDYKYALFVKKNLLNKKNNHFFSSPKENEELIPHCNKCKKDGFYIHECGNKFQIYKYKSMVVSNDINCLNNFTKTKYLLYCAYCDMIYKSDLIKIKCNLTQENFYTKISNKEKDINTQLIKKCKIEFDPKKMVWKCIKCKKDFNAEIKLYNPLEYKNMKICVKEAIYNKKKARPKYLGCNCNIDNINRINFFHKNNCKGNLYLWELNNKKVVICQECESLGLYEGYTWTCPFCFKRFKINNEKENNHRIITNEYFNQSKNNFYNNNNKGIYISPNKLRYKYSFNNSKEKEKNENNKIKIFRRINSAAKLNVPSTSKKIINNIKIINNKENKENKTPNITLINNNNNSNSKYNKNNIFNKYISTEKEKKNTKYNNEFRYKKNVIENSSKIINKTPLKKFKRSYSNCIRDDIIKKIENIKTPSKINNNINKKIPKSNKKEIINKLSPGKFNINDYKIKRQIGEGSFGQIFLVEDKNKNKYALKKIIADNSEDINNIKKEYQILIDIQNNNKNINVVNIIGISNYKLDLTTHVLYVLMELANTDWEKEILKRKIKKNYYEENELMNILSILIKSLSILQKQKISHRDIKPQNILVFYKNNETIYKLADFGEAKELYKDDKPTNRQTLRGTELYMSPILFYALRASKIMKYVKHNTYKSDVFSFGLCALFAATLCFESLYDIRELKSNISLKIVVNRYLKGRYSYKVIDIITKMLDINETTRFDFIELYNEFQKLGY